MSDYEDLLAQLQSDEAPKVVTTPVNKLLGGKAYEITVNPLKQDSYSRDDVEQLFGFILSFAATVIVKLSSSLSLTLSKDDAVMTKRLDKYIETLNASGYEMGDAAKELAAAFSKSLSKSIGVAIEDQQESFTETMPLSKFIAIMSLLFSVGGHYAKIQEGERPDRAKLLSGAMAAAYADVLRTDDPELLSIIETIVAEVLEELPNYDLDLLVRSPEAFLDFLKNRNKDND